MPISLNGFYKARFSMPDGESGGGVIMLTDGKLCGGNGDLMYLGSYTQNGDSFTADIVTKRLWLQTSGLIKEDVNIKIVGRGGFQNIMCTGSSPQLPGVELKAVLERVPF
jgi:hypothetical protein